MVTGYSRWLSRAADPVAGGRGPVRRLVAAASPSWGRCRGCWCGTVRARSASGAGGQTVLTEAGARVPWGAGRQGADLRPGRSGGQGAGRAGQRLSGDLVPARPQRSPRPADFNAQLAGWLHAGQPAAPSGAGLRPGRPDRGRPGRDAGRCRRSRRQTGWRSSLRLPRDHYVRLDSNDYSVHPAVDRPPRRGRRRPGPGRGWPATGGWSPTMSAAGPGTRRISDPAHLQAAAQLRHDRAAVGATAGRRDQAEVELRCLADYDAAFGLDDRGGGLMAATTTKTAPGPDRRARVPDPGAEGADACARRSAGWPSGPGPRAGPTRSSWPPACNARSPPANPTAARAASAPPGSRPARAWRSSTSTTPAASNASTIAHLGTLDFVTARENVVFLGPPGTGKTHLAIGLAIRACQAGHRVLFATAAEWVDPPRRRPRRRPAAGRAGPAGPLPAAGHRRGRLHPLRGRGRQPVLPARLGPLRTRQPDRHQQQAVRPLGRGLRRRRRRRGHDRPPRPPRRGRRPQRRQLPAQGPRPRPRPRGHHRRANDQPRGSVFTRRQGVSFRPSLT